MRLDVIVVGAGPAGIGISVMLVDLGVKSMLVLEKGKVGASFNKWPKEMKLITPSFTTNFYGQIDPTNVYPSYHMASKVEAGFQMALLQ